MLRKSVLRKRRLLRARRVRKRVARSPEKRNGTRKGTTKTTSGEPFGKEKKLCAMAAAAASEKLWCIRRVPSEPGVTASVVDDTEDKGDTREKRISPG